MDYITQSSQKPYLGDTIIITTILQMSKLPKAIEQSVMGLRCDIMHVGSEVVLLHMKLSCLLA